MSLALDKDAVIRIASPDGSLRKTFLPLWNVPPRAVKVAMDIAEEDARLEALRRHFEAWKAPDSEERRKCGEVPDRELIWLATGRRDLSRVFANYEKLLPRRWVDLLSWGHWVAMYLLPPELPVLRHAFEALLEVEPQLHVDAYHPNRDHIVHQIADACLVTELYNLADSQNQHFDQEDWDCLVRVIPECKRWNVSERRNATRAGLALAGLTHDVGYIRYVGAVARERLSTVFGVAAPAPSIAAWDLARVFSGSLLERMLANPSSQEFANGVDGIIVDLYQNAWRRADHGPLSAFVLASAARGLRLEGRSAPDIEAILQIAIAAAFLHELHPNKDGQTESPRVVAHARERLKRYFWPSLFRIVDDLQCWFRPHLTAHGAGSAGEGTDIDLGADGFSIENGTLTIQCGANQRGTKESEELTYLLEHGNAGHAFKALGVRKITCKLR